MGINFKDFANLYKNGRQSFDYLPISTHDDSVLELFYKDLYQLYNLKNTLESEGLDNYIINHCKTDKIKLLS